MRFAIEIERGSLSLRSWFSRRRKPSHLVSPSSQRVSDRTLYEFSLPFLWISIKLKFPNQFSAKRSFKRYISTPFNERRFFFGYDLSGSEVEVFKGNEFSGKRSFKRYIF